MYKLIKTVFAAAAVLLTASCASGGEEAADMSAAPAKTETMLEYREDTETAADEKEENVMYIKVGESVLTAELADNSSAEALKEMLAGGDVTVEMSDYGNFEKVGSLGKTLPRNDEQITTEAGDVILYQGDKITIYYDTNSWNFTNLGKIKDVSQKELKNILGSGDVTVTLSLTK